MMVGGEIWLITLITGILGYVSIKLIREKEREKFTYYCYYFF